jgi:hypothetical protein
MFGLKELLQSLQLSIDATASHQRKEKAMDEETKRKALRILEDYGAINIEAEFDGAHSIEHRLVHLIEGISDAEKVQVSEEAIALGELERSDS